MHINFYANDEEERDIIERARQEGLSVSGFVRRSLGLAPVGVFGQILEDTRVLAEAVPVGTEFSVPDLYTALDWQTLTEQIGAGQLGRRFNESVTAGDVAGVVSIGVKNRRATYRKE